MQRLGEIPQNYHAFALFDSPPKGSTGVSFNDPCYRAVIFIYQSWKILTFNQKTTSEPEDHSVWAIYYKSLT